MALTRVFTSWWRGAPDPEAALLAEARQGNNRAFDELRRMHDAPLRGFVTRRIGADGADDLTQEIWLACWQALPKFERRSRFKAWVYGIAVYKCADYLRARMQTARGQEALQLARNDPPNAYAAIDLRQSVLEALRRIPDDQREVLELYYYADLTLAEIAHLLDRNLNTVKYRFYRAHTRVGEELQIEDVKS